MESLSDNQLVWVIWSVYYLDTILHILIWTKYTITLACRDNIVVLCGMHTIGLMNPLLWVIHRRNWKSISKIAYNSLVY